MKLKKTTIGGIAANVVVRGGLRIERRRNGDGRQRWGGRNRRRAGKRPGGLEARPRAAAERAARPAGAGGAGGVGRAGTVGGGGRAAGGGVRRGHGRRRGRGGRWRVGARGRPTVPPALAVPAGATLAIHDHGSGVQIYTCTPSGGAGGAAGSGADAGAITYSWVLQGSGREAVRRNRRPGRDARHRSRMDLQRRQRRQRDQGGAGQRAGHGPGRDPLAAPAGVVDDRHGRLQQRHLRPAPEHHAAGSRPRPAATPRRRGRTRASPTRPTTTSTRAAASRPGSRHPPTSRARSPFRPGARSPFMTTGSARRSTPAPPAAARAGPRAAARTPGSSPIPGCSRGRTRSSPTPPSRRSGRTAWVRPGPPPTGA